MKDYKTLNTSEKKNISQVLNLKHQLIDVQEKLNKASEKVFAIVKENNGIYKEAEKISYIAQGSTKIVLDTEKLKNDFPEIYAQCLTTKDGAKEHIAIYVK